MRGRKRLSVGAFACGLVISLIASLFLDVSVLAAGTPSASAQDTSIPKTINVVYDDSGSMYSGKTTRWSQAKYALEVFTAMMGEKDTLNIFTMSEFDPLNPEMKKHVMTVKGSDKNRVKSVHDMNSEFWNTPIESIEAAGDALSGASADSDRWLVVLTDGEIFYRNGQEYSKQDTVAELERLLNGYAGKYKVAYLAIGDKQADIKSTSESFHIYSAKDTGGEILKRVTEIANTIFEYQQLPASVVSTGAGGYDLSIDIPVTQLVAFAQGETVNIGKMSRDGDGIKGDTMTVKFSDVLPLKANSNGPGTEDDRAVTDTTLKGVVATYKGGDDPIPGGKFSVDISGASGDNVAFYYKPGVIATCMLVDADGNEVVASKDGITAGEYRVQVGFVDPTTNEIVDSELLKIKNSEIDIKNNGNALDASSGTVTIEEGDFDMHLAIDLEGDVRIETDRSFKVAPEPLRMKLVVQSPENPYLAQQLGENAAPILVSVIDEKTGTNITQEQWDACDIKVSGEKGEKNLSWDLVSKGSAVGTYEIRPAAKNDKSVSKISTGKYRFDVEVDCKYNGEKYKLQEAGYILISAYEGTALVITAEEVPNPVRAMDIKEFEGIPVRVLMVDDVTGETVPITEEIWNELSLKCARPRTKNVWWSINKGNEVGTYILKPSGPFGLKLFIFGALKGRESLPNPIVTETGVTISKASTIMTPITASGRIGPLMYTGDGEASMKIAPLTLREIWSLIWRYVLAFVAFLVWFIGTFVRKRRINDRAMSPHIVFSRNEVDCEMNVHFFRRYVIPYVPERADVFCNDPSMKCNIPDLLIEASTRSSFRIVNYEEVFEEKIRVGEEYLGPTDYESLKKRTFGYYGFRMTQIPKNGRRAGQFHMSQTK